MSGGWWSFSAYLWLVRTVQTILQLGPLRLRRQPPFHIQTSNQYYYHYYYYKQPDAINVLLLLVLLMYNMSLLLLNMLNRMDELPVPRHCFSLEPKWLPGHYDVQDAILQQRGASTAQVRQRARKLAIHAHERLLVLCANPMACVLICHLLAWFATAMPSTEGFNALMTPQNVPLRFGMLMHCIVVDQDQHRAMANLAPLLE